MASRSPAERAFVPASVPVQCGSHTRRARHRPHNMALAAPTLPSTDTARGREGRGSMASRTSTMTPAVSPVRTQGGGGARRRAHVSLERRVKGYAAWKRRADEAIVRREMERASPVRQSPLDDSLAPMRLRCPDEGYFRHGALLAQREAAEAAVEELMATVAHSAEDANVLATLGGTLRTAVAPPESFKHGAASVADDGASEAMSISSRALGGKGTASAMESLLEAVARGEEVPEGMGGVGASRGERVQVGGVDLTVNMTDSGLADLGGLHGSAKHGPAAYKRRVALKAAVARALTTPDGRPPWNHDPVPDYVKQERGKGAARFTAAIDRSDKYFDASGRKARGPLAFLHPPSHAGRYHPLRSDAVAVSEPRLGSVTPHSRRAWAAGQDGDPAEAVGADATPAPSPAPSPSPSSTKLFAAAARRGSVMPTAGSALGKALTVMGQGGGGMEAIEEEGMTEAQYYAALYSSGGAGAPSPTQTRRPPPSSPAPAAPSKSAKSSATAVSVSPSAVPAATPRQPAWVATKLSKLAASRRAVRAALGGAHLPQASTSDV